MVKFIAEICSNHNGNLGRAIELISAAKEIGCDAVKFQLFRVDQLFAPELLDHPGYTFVQERRQWELPPDWLASIAIVCREMDIEFGCTPFYLEAVGQLLPYVDFYKIASYELLWGQLLDSCLETGKPVLLSCGMANMVEIRMAVYQAALKCNDTGRRLTLLHCISEYPASPSRCHLSFMARLRAEIKSIAGIGYSDHSVRAGVVHRAVHQFGARAVEFHLDLDDRAGNEYRLGHCWTAGEAARMIEEIKEGLMADGDGEGPALTDERDFRADPLDGLRPMRYKRRDL